MGRDKEILASGGELDAEVSSDFGGDDLADRLVGVKGGFGELFRAAHTRVFHQDVVGLADLSVEVFGDLGLSGRTQAGGAGFDDGSVHGGHAGGRRALAGGVGKDVKPRQAAVLHQV